MRIDKGILLGILVFCIAILISSCWAKMTKFKFYEDPDLMEQEIQRFISLGSSVTEARKIMESNGFVCDYVENSTFARERDDPSAPGGVKQTIYENVDFLYCDISKGFIVSRRWQAALVYEDSQVTFISVSTGLTGP
ncbi:MAG: hypothetical protein SW833_21740 [Cyanobacteriota bacterium]|nr:hypothetical protein [Cyanobacteriota bacterium]